MQRTKHERRFCVIVALTVETRTCEQFYVDLLGNGSRNGDQILDKSTWHRQMNNSGLAPWLKISIKHRSALGSHRASSFQPPDRFWWWYAFPRSSCRTNAPATANSPWWCRSFYCYDPAVRLCRSSIIPRFRKSELLWKTYIYKRPKKERVYLYLSKKRRTFRKSREPFLWIDWAMNQYLWWT